MDVNEEAPAVYHPQVRLLFATLPFPVALMLRLTEMPSPQILLYYQDSLPPIRHPCNEPWLCRSVIMDSSTYRSHTHSLIMVVETYWVRFTRNLQGNSALKQDALPFACSCGYVRRRAESVNAFTEVPIV